MSTTKKLLPAEGAKIIELKVGLNAGKKLAVMPMLGKHMRKAKQYGAEDPSLIEYWMLHLCTTIDGKAPIVEQLDEMPALEVSELLSHLKETLGELPN